MIRNAGELVDHIKEAVQSHGATPMTEVRIRVGGLEFQIAKLTGVQDQRGFSLILDGWATPTNG